MTERYEGRGTTLDIAIDEAVKKIPAQKGKDFAVGRVVEWGMQRGGFVDSRLYYVVLEEDTNASFRS